MSFVSQGTWGVGGVNLPDFGLTELFSKSSPTPTTFYNPQSPTGQVLGTQAGMNTAGDNYPNTRTPTSLAGATTQVTTSSAPTGGSPSGSGTTGDWVADGYHFTNEADYNNYKAQRDYANSEVGRREAQVRNDINSGYDAYFGQLDQMLGGIGNQRQGQEQIVQNNYNQGVSDLASQKESSIADLNTSRRKNQEQQVKSLNDIADNIHNLYQTGNVMLGTRGAGDSSAANQYSYAVTKLGTKQRGDVMSQTRSIENDIADREAKLNNVVTQETQKLKTDRDNQILQIAQYFQDKQNELMQAKAQGQLQKGQSLANLSTQLLQQAQQYLMQADADFKNKQNTLMTWAANNATNINQLKTNLAAVGQYNVPGIQRSAINGAPTFDAQGNMTTMWSNAGTKDELKNPFTSQ